MTAPAGFPARLLRLRANAGLTQKELAAASGVSVPQIARYETGVSKPRMTALVKLANALKVDLQQLTDADDEPETVEIEGHFGGKIEPLALPKSHIDFLQADADRRGVTIEAMLLLALRSFMTRSKGEEVDEDKMLKEIVEHLRELDAEQGS